MRNFSSSARHAAIGFAIGTTGYIGTGNDGQFKNDFWAYDPINDTWSQRASLPGQPRRGAIGVAAGPFGYIGTGFRDPDNVLNNGDEELYRDFWQYNPVTNNWTRKADFPGKERRNAAAFTIGTKLYVGLGSSGAPINEFHGDFWEYDTSTNNWSRKANFGGTARADPIAFTVGAKAYVGTGWYIPPSGGAPIFLPDLWEFDPLAGPDINGDRLPDGRWTLLAPLPFDAGSRADAVSFTIGNRAYVATGMDNFGQFFQDLWEYDASNNSWTERAPLPGVGRGEAVAFSLPTIPHPLGRAFVATGDSASGRLKDVWAYSP